MDSRPDKEQGRKVPPEHPAVENRGPATGLRLPEGRVFMPQRFKQLCDIAQAMRLYLQHRRLEHGGAEKLAAYQDRQLKRLVRHAASRSKFYGELYRDIDVDGDVRLQDLPVVDKRLLMDRFDDWVTDPRLKRADIERQIARAPQEQYYLGQYRIIASSGSSGLRGIFVCDRKEWSVVIAAALRWATMFGISPLALSYKKLASVGAGKPMHATTRLGQSMNLGIRNLMMLDATEPLEHIVAQLNDFRPDLLMGYASLIALLAEEQIAGRLRIAPQVVATFSEMLGPDRIRRARDAWGLTPFNHYGAAEEVMIAADCEAHLGLHHFADLSIVEIVDKDRKPVPDGTPGQAILLTNLHRFVQPIIRYEITDLVTRAPDACSCKRSFPLFSQVGGRTEDILVLPGQDGKELAIAPIVIVDRIIEHADVVEYQYLFDGTALRFSVVAREGCDRDRLDAALRQTLRAMLADRGAIGVRVDVAFVDHMLRSGETMGKLKLTGAAEAADAGR